MAAADDGDAVKKSEMAAVAAGNNEGNLMVFGFMQGAQYGEYRAFNSLTGPQIRQINCGTCQGEREGEREVSHAMKPMLVGRSLRRSLYTEPPGTAQQPHHETQRDGVVTSSSWPSSSPSILASSPHHECLVVSGIRTRPGAPCASMLAHVRGPRCLPDCALSVLERPTAMRGHGGDIAVGRGILRGTWGDTRTSTT